MFYLLEYNAISTDYTVLRMVSSVLLRRVALVISQKIVLLEY
jgi:hypothetical protein